MTGADIRGLLTDIPDRENQPAIFDPDGGPRWTRAALREAAAEWSVALAAPSPGLVFLLCRNEASSIATLLGAIQAGHAVALLDPASASASFDRMTEAFRPDFIVDGEAVRAIPKSRTEPISGDLAVMLSTSGTTGSLKFVRLSAANLAANADQIIAALGMSAEDVGAAHLPMHYSYGLSVITSHLRVGGAVHLWSDTVTDPAFWTAAGRAGVTQFPGVPFHYNFLARGDLANLVPPTLRTFTQAGGALAPRLQSRMAERAAAIGGRFFVMYGQTEAAPRMTTLPHDGLTEKLGSVGPALPGGRLRVIGEDGRELAAGEVGQVIYEGPNVMLGYAEGRDDLALGDVMGGRLETGDLGLLDAEGYLTLTGRTKRFAKLHGLRIGLDEVEARFAAAGEVAALEKGDKILLFTTASEAAAALVPTVAAEYKIQAMSLAVRPVEALPRKPSGKVDYAALEALA